MAGNHTTVRKEKRLYENVFTGKMGALYARLYDPETEDCTLERIKFIPSIFIKCNENSPNKSPYFDIIDKQPLQELKYKTMKEFRDAMKLYGSSNTQMFGNKTPEQGYTLENWPNPTDCDHKFHTWFFDIETLVDLPEECGLEKDVIKDDWKPHGHERAAMAQISLIQIYDTKDKQFYIFGLKKDWEEKDKFESEHGKINYFNMSSEENLLKAFIGLLDRKRPSVLSGWNSEGYDIPFITNRIIRVLDKRDDIYYFDKNKKEWRFNTDCLNGGYVQQLSQVGLIKHREQETNYGKQDEFTWVGYFLEDYLELYRKYTYTNLTSYSLDNVASHELGSNKVNHDEFADFGAFYRGDYIKYDYNEKKKDKSELDLLYIELLQIDKELKKRGLNF